MVDMPTRILYGVLALLVFVAPLSATLCGACIAGHCNLPSALEGDLSEDPVTTEVETPGRAESAHSTDMSASVPPCHAAMGSAVKDSVDAPESTHSETPSETDSKVPQSRQPCHDEAPTLASFGCCPAPTLQDRSDEATSAGWSVFDVALEPAADGILSLTVEARRARHESRIPPHGPPRPLYTLHSSFLI